MKIYCVNNKFGNLGLDPIGTWIYRIYKDRENAFKYNINMVPKLNFLISNYNPISNPYLTVSACDLGVFFIDTNKTITNKKIISYI
jgi:hypothetical protein